MAKIIGLTFLMSLFLLVSFAPKAEAAIPRLTASVETKFLSESGVTLEELAEGAYGKGILLYYLPERGPEYPSLAVHLSKDAGSAFALAEVYQAVPPLNYVKITTEKSDYKIEARYGASIIIKSSDGWWVKQGKPSYNLDIQVNGQMVAMWGPDYDPNLGFSGWPKEVTPEEPTVRIRVGDPAGEGIPKWDFRSLLPDFGTHTYFRTNYAERMCPTQFKIDQGVSPLWPYVANAGGFEQKIGQFQPPIVVDWKQGKIIHFSELVTVRNQNCSYSLYSLNSFTPNKINQVDFEAPFAFYDLSNQGVGYPNLIIRTEHYYPHDTRSSQIDPVQLGRTVPKDIEWIRYSWRNAVGDEFIDYKVDLMGLYPYTSKTPIAGGLIQIDAPSYEEYPGWIMKQNWPVITFVQAANSKYYSTEGIYEWSTLEAGLEYLFGWSDGSRQDSFKEILAGLRGEYLINPQAKPLLYLSPVDQQLHLYKASGGVWNIDNSSQIRYVNQGASNYINQWTYSQTITGTSPITLTRQLNVADNHLIYGDEKEVIIRNTRIPPPPFETLPPANHDEWQTLIANLAKAKPTIVREDFKGMLKQFEGSEMQISNAALRDYRAVANSDFRFVLSLKNNYAVTGIDLLNLNKLSLAPGEYLIEYKNGFEINKLTPAQLEVKVDLNFSDLSQTIQSGVPLQLLMKITNSGLEDSKPLTFTVTASKPGNSQALELARKEITVFGQNTTTLEVPWTPRGPGTWIIQVKTQPVTTSGNKGEKIVKIFNYTAASAKFPTSAQTLSAFGLVPQWLPLLFLALAGITTGGLVLWVHSVHDDGKELTTNDYRPPKNKFK